MRVLVSGASGFIGRHVTRALLHAGHEVVGLYHTRRPVTGDAVHWVQFDLSKEDWIPAEGGVSGVEGLIHLAASGVDPRSANWGECFDINVTCAMRFWLAAVKHGVRRIVNCGSCFEYGSAADKYEFVPSLAAPEPMNAYAASKAAATMALHGVVASHDILAASLRPCVVFGEGEPEYRLWPSLRRAAMAGEDFPMTTGEQVRDFVPVQVLAAKLCQGLTRNDLTPGRLLVENVGSGEAQSVRDFAIHWWNHWGGSGELNLGALPRRTSECARIVPEM